jgi:hypothetical protein
MARHGKLDRLHRRTIGGLRFDLRALRCNLSA